MIAHLGALLQFLQEAHKPVFVVHRWSAAGPDGKRTHHTDYGVVCITCNNVGGWPCMTAQLLGAVVPWPPARPAGLPDGPLPPAQQPTLL